MLQSTMRIRFGGIISSLLALFSIASVSCTLVHAPVPCCGTTARPRRIFQQIATRPEEVPIELQGCGTNREEITAITINGTLGSNSAVVRTATIDLSVT